MHPVTRRTTLALFAGIAILRPGRVYAGPIHVDSTRFAVGGYDVVAYHGLPQGGSRPARPVPGSLRIIEVWQGASFAFASEENRQRFRADPARFSPQFDGHCAWAAGQGYKAPGSPAVWRLVDGRLYLNYSHEIRRRWEKGTAGQIASANAHWRKLGSEAAASGNGEDYDPKAAPVA